MNKIASTTARKSIYKTVARPTYCTTVLGVYTNEGTVLGDLYKYLLEPLGYNTLWEYLQTKHKWTSVLMKKIGWTALESTLKVYQPTYSTRIMQLMPDWQVIGERKALMCNEDNLYPMQCGHIETKLHYLWCKDKEISTLREKHLHLLQTQLKAIETYPGIVTTVTKILNRDFLTGWIQDFGTNTPLDIQLTSTIHEQQKLGPNSLAKGYVTTE